MLNKHAVYKLSDTYQEVFKLAVNMVLKLEFLKSTVYLGIYYIIIA